MKQDNLLYELDREIDKIKNYCLKFLENKSDFNTIKRKLSITPTFLFYGLPGTGKTTTANEVYYKLKENFDINRYYLKIESIISHNFGESSKNLIKFFDDIKRELNENSDSYAFIIIDELDSFTVNRAQNDSESIKRILLTFNSIIDDLTREELIDKIILIATTNMKESIDTSILRRFFFHERFDISLDEKQFFEFIEEIKKISSVFSKIGNKEKKELYDIYSQKKFTLGEIKTIFAHLYMENIISNYSEELSLEIFKTEKSFYQLINEQTK